MRSDADGLSRPNSPINRRSFLALTGLAGMGLTGALAGCGTGGAASPARSGPVAVDVWTNDPNYITYFTSWADKLSKTPGSPFQYSVDSLLQSPDQVVTKMLTSHMSGSTLPDIAGFEISQFSRLQRDNIGGELVLDLRKEIPDLDKNFFASRIVPYTVGDAVYGLESDMCMGVYFYREDLFQKYGLPTDFETWDDLIAIGAKAHQQHQVSVAAIGSGDIAWMAMLMLQHGGQFFGTDGSLQVDNPSTINALKLLRRGVQEGAFLNLTNFYGAAGVAALTAGQVIGYFMPDWFLPFVLQLNAPQQAGAWRQRAFPRFPDSEGVTGVWGGTGFGITKNQTGTDAALSLLKQAYTTSEGQVQRFLQANYLPTMKSAWTDPRLLTYESKFLGGQRPFDVFKPLVEKAPTMITSPYWDVMSAQMVIALSQSISGDATPEQAVSQAASSIRSQMV